MKVFIGARFSRLILLHDGLLAVQVASAPSDFEWHGSAWRFSEPVELTSTLHRRGLTSDRSSACCCPSWSSRSYDGFPIHIFVLASSHTNPTYQNVIPARILVSHPLPSLSQHLDIHPHVGCDGQKVAEKGQQMKLRR